MRSEVQTPENEPLSRERIALVAVALADADGIEGLSMRKLASELGTAPMSLYRHLANKEMLLDAMVDIVFGEMYPPGIGTDWKGELRKRGVSAAKPFVTTLGRTASWRLASIPAPRAPSITTQRWGV